MISFLSYKVVFRLRFTLFTRIFSTALYIYGLSGVGLNNVGVLVLGIVSVAMNRFILPQWAANYIWETAAVSR